MAEGFVVLDRQERLDAIVRSMWRREKRPRAFPWDHFLIRHAAKHGVRARMVHTDLRTFAAEARWRWRVSMVRGLEAVVR